MTITYLAEKKTYKKNKNKNKQTKTKKQKQKQKNNPTYTWIENVIYFKNNFIRCSQRVLELNYFHLDEYIFMEVVHR